MAIYKETHSSLKAKQMVQYNTEILDRLVAPGISRFTSAEIPSLEDQFKQARFWLENHYLETIVGSRYKPEKRSLIVGFLRRACLAFRSYHDARVATLKYLNNNQPDNPKIGQYYDAVNLWEVFIAQTAMSVPLWISLTGVKLFEKNDGTALQRVYTIANHVKHFDSCVSSGQSNVDETLPLWLGNEGVCSFEVSVSYGELASVATFLAEWADDLHIPRAFAEKSRKRLESSSVT